MREEPVPVVAVIASVLALLSACSPIVALNALLVPGDGFSAARDIAYGPHQRQRLDVYRPQPQRAEGPAPVVVFFYGGSWRGGQRAYYRFVGQALAERGYVVVVPDYRVFPEVRFPVFVEDGARAVAWTRAHAGEFGGDRDRLFLMGHSAGAHIAGLLAVDRRYLAAAGTDPGCVRALAGLAGPYAFDPLRYDSTRPVFEGAAVPAETVPANVITGVPAPMLLLHGLDDDTVYPVNSETFAERARAAGGRATFIGLPGTGHIGIVLAFARPFRREGGVLDTIDAFLRAQTGGGGRAADAAAVSSGG